MYITGHKFGIIQIFKCLWKNQDYIFFYPKYSKNSNTVNYYYSLKELYWLNIYIYI